MFPEPALVPNSLPAPVVKGKGRTRRQCVVHFVRTHLDSLGFCRAYNRLVFRLLVSLQVSSQTPLVLFVPVGDAAMSWDCGLRYMFSVSPSLQPGTMCVLHDKEELSRLEMVQRLAKDGCRFLQNHSKGPDKANEPVQSDEAVRVQERGRCVLVLQRMSSQPARGGGKREEEEEEAVRNRRYMVVSGTPEKILDHMLNGLRLEEDQAATQGKETDTLLDDFLLTYPVFMSTSDLCQALLGHYCCKCCRVKEDAKEALERKQKVAHLVSQWMLLCRDFLREDEHVKVFMKTLYRYMLDDLYEHPALERDVRELQKLYQLHRRHTVEEYSPQRKSKALFHQLSLKENGVLSRATHRQTKEVPCHVYITMDSYLSMRAHPGVVAQELLQAVAERMDVSQGELVLVAVTYPGGRLLLQPHDTLFSPLLRPVGRLHVCRKDLGEVLNPFTENSKLQQRTARMLSLNTWNVAVALSNIDWTIFNSVHEQELIYFTFRRHTSGSHPAALELLLQRCNEIQLWVMTEVLLCTALCQRVQLIKKFIKIAAHCKAQRNLHCFFAIIMGLNTAAVSRLSQTWEKIPGKFKKLFSELESITDPSLNHKAYRDTFKKMKAPKIPFLPLLLKDITFIHEGNKTFHENLVNFEKLHMIADTVRLIRQCRKDHLGNGISPKSSAEVHAYMDNLHIIDNQQSLFELSHRLEPRT
ncbi:rap guanine nucleotide exchange factor 5-like isoform X1 [Phyllopteryx taeniolatus]|uniref:rap guanine nucleotide exchange factor 5-like isoform X1 n=1 Tax=Phyllopteryx taeniolatus TaxID=161469 RepID=UPI002AD42C58|nr:rap guanine nucleotide exchange factor 5-like isoform X1 [Phyllopteryx taeniolatus]